MAGLKHDATGRRVTLAARSLVGRAEACVVRVAARCASAEHAVLQWDGARWWARDLGSTNGTLVDGRRLGVGERAPLRAGASLCFGGDDERWRLEDDAAPATRARRAATGEARAAVDGLLPLPDAADPRATVFEDASGRWHVELDGEVRPARDHERLELAGDAWVLEVCPSSGGAGAVPTTQPLHGDPKIVSAMTLRFQVSRDGEHIALSLVRGASVTPLGARAHHEVLLVLARARLRDREAGIAPSECGWLYIDDVLAELGLDLQHFNVTVFRARQHLAREGVLDAGALFERRSTTRQIRLGTDAVEITSG